VAAIPEGLPIVATLALARGLLRMARRNAIVQRLAAVEALGATTIICTDKTGTLTMNELTVERVLTAAGSEHAAGDPLLERVLTIGVLCNNASLDAGGSAIGDPLEAALLRAGRDAGLDREDLLESLPEIREEAFDPRSKMMATLHEADGRVLVAVKGAPESVLEACTTMASTDGDRPLDAAARASWLEHVDQLATDGLRVLAHADRTVDHAAADVLTSLRLLGLVGFADPPRPDAAAAVDACGRAGVRVVMVTGDQPITARSIARAVGLVEDGEATVWQGKDLTRLRAADPGTDAELARVRVFARVTPAEKLDLIEAFQRQGHVVAMTGDGVNDAPALRKADIGVAMGRRGTQVAREAADMVLEDDALSTIIAAVRQGRVIFDNIRRFVMYLLSCNLSEVLVIASASVTPAPLPVLPLQILFLNLVTDVFPALALGLGEGSEDVVERPPRPGSEQILMREHWKAMAVWACLITVAVLGAFWLAIVGFGMDDSRAVTVSFLTLAFAQLWHVFNMRLRGSRVSRNAVVGNPWVWAALGICVSLLAAAVWLPPFARVLGVVSPGLDGWGLVLGMSLFPAVAGQFFLVRGDSQAHPRASGTIG